MMIKSFYLSFCLISISTSILLADDLRSLADPEQLEPAAPLIPDLPPLPCDGDEKVLLPELKGLILVGDPVLVVKEKTDPVTGIIIENLCVPGDPEELIERLEPFLCQRYPITQKRLNQIKREIVLYYREQHHPVVMVFVPEQKILDGVLQLVVIESYVNQLCVICNQYTRSETILRWMRIQPCDYIDEKVLLQDISWINMNPYRSVNVIFSPGEENGTTDITLKVSDRKSWRWYVGGDNTGSKFIGEARWFTGINFNNVFFTDHLLSYQYTTATGFKRFQSHTAEYVAPFPWRNTLNVFGGYAVVRPHIIGFRTHGKSYQVSGRYDIPIWPTYPFLPQQLTLGLDFKGTNNNIIFGEDNSDIIQSSIVNVFQFVFGYHANFERCFQKIAAGIDVFWSPGELISHQSREDYQTLNVKAEPKYVYTRLNYNHHVFLPKQFSLFGQFRAQFSNANLLASEQFALGGFNTVRGYPERVVNADNALCVNLELCSPYASFIYNMSKRAPRDTLYFLVFFDYGHGWDHSQVPGLPLKQTLMGIGPGVRYRIGSYFTSRFDIGFPLRDVPGSKEKVRIHLSVVLSY